ncbi:DNA-directed RNA polymerase subunit alpha C-terminal domain-containing protein [Lacrimispora sp.]|uniref:DNA-directed RNA polymerase subunit alpha C-terminal domain-containing protein n=1 Tax=Lacrimispora sp. TaxID=2719234 RepID=UPI003460C8A2
MSKVEIRNDKGKTTVLLNGTDISNMLSGVDLKIEAGCYPNLRLYAPLVPSAAILLNNAEVKSDNKLLQIVAEILRTELVQKGDWYNALVASIHDYIHEADGSVPYYQMAVALANRIIGIEPEGDDDSIDNLNLTVRTYNCLKRAGVETVSQLSNIYSEDLLKIKNFTQQSLDELAEKLEKYELLERDSS